MDIEAIQKFINPILTENDPNEPGLYLYLRHKEELRNQPIIDLVEVRYYKDAYLIAESDNWDGYLPVNSIKKYFPGKWSKKIYFKK